MSLPDQSLLTALQRRLGYEFSDSDLLRRALTHRSAHRDHNERLEFLGDALIGMTAAAAFFERFPDADEGALSRLRAAVVSGQSLARIAQSLELSNCLILGESERKSGGRHRQSILADSLEALAGAVLLDASAAEAQQVVEGWLHESIEAASPSDVVDAKTRLQEWLQARGKPLPEYSVIEVRGVDHEQSFRVQCLLAHLQLRTEAVGSSRRGAEKMAASGMLEKLVDKVDD